MEKKLPGLLDLMEQLHYNPLKALAETSWLQLIVCKE
jgi:hypothetical protein